MEVFSMNETVNQVTESKPTEAAQKTFTQAEVDAIVRDRLTRDRAKYADYDALKAKAEEFDKIEEANKTELQKAQERAEALGKELADIKRSNEIRDMRAKVAQEKGIPAHLLTNDTEEECIAQADSIIAFAKPSAYPTVKDGGEVVVTAKKSDRDQFADWFEQIQQ